MSSRQDSNQVILAEDTVRAFFAEGYHLFTGQQRLPQLLHIITVPDFLPILLVEITDLDRIGIYGSAAGANVAIPIDPHVVERKLTEILCRFQGRKDQVDSGFLSACLGDFEVIPLLVNDIEQELIH